MNYRFCFKSYCRELSIPLRTGHGVWTQRKGVLVRIQNDEGSLGFGEVAPLEAFGTESLEAAFNFFSQLGASIDDATIEKTPSRLRCCRYALESARDFLRMQDTSPPRKVLDVAALLPAGRAALESFDTFLKARYTTFKWKIGVEPLASEIEIFKELIARCPQSVSLRLDANGSLTEWSALEWMEPLVELGAGKVEFLEQPLPRGKEEAMFALADRYPVPLALDESAVELRDLKHLAEKGWRGIFVVKPLLLGSLEAFRKWREQCARSLVYSSAFETAVGVESVLRLAATDGFNRRAIGFGSMAYFEDDGLSLHSPRCRFLSGVWSANDFEVLWKRI